MKNNPFFALGTSKALSQAGVYDTSVIKCDSDSSWNGISEQNTESTTFYAELSEPMSSSNLATSCAEDPMANTTAFLKDGLYNDITRYSVTSNAIDSFNKIFSNNGLYGDQLAAASTAFYIKELGYSVSLIILKSETALIEFCQNRNWEFKIVG